MLCGENASVTYALCDIYADDYAKLSKGNEVGEAINVTVDGNTSNVEGVQLGEDINEVVVGNAVNDEGINEVGAGNVVDDEVIKDVATGHGVDINVELPDVEDLGHATNEDEVQVGEKETSQDSIDFLVNVKFAFDLDDEVEGIRVNLRVDRHECLTNVSKGEDNNDAEYEGQPNVGNDLVEEGEDVPELEGKLQDHESDYIELMTHRSMGKVMMSPELGLRFENHKQFKETMRKYAIAKGVALSFKKSEPKRVKVCCKQHCTKELGVYVSLNKCQRTRLNLLSEKRGFYVDEYVNIWGYTAELLLGNLGSIVSIQVHRENDNKAIFHICFNALKKGWCIPFIGVDNCFLKTVTQGELLRGQLRKEKEMSPRSGS
ncbi:hypothetical protein GQ457_09G013670 [Hibiscus cannabinus]